MKNKVFIIAEAGVNHNGSLQKALELIDIANESGADAVKFQTFISEEVVSINASQAEYQISNTLKTETQLEMVKRLELSFKEFKFLSEYCEKVKIKFMSTPFDFKSADFLIDDLKVDLIKIPSGEITNAPLILHIARKRIRIILSTGMSTLTDIESALGVIAFGLQNSKGVPSIEEFHKAYNSEEGQTLLKKYVSILHCTTEYPAPIEEVNLNTMNTLTSAFRLPVGYSDHTKGVEIPVAATALGATIIEKHFTFDKNAKGPDHKASLSPEELKVMINSIRNVEKSLGNFIKKPTISEMKNMVIARKSLVANSHILIGTEFNKENLAIKRPGSGISPFRFWELIGCTSNRDYKKDELI